MQTLLGPVLLFVNATSAAWNCRALFVFRGLTNPPPDVSYDDGQAMVTAVGRQIFVYQSTEVWVYDLTFVRTAADASRNYSLEGSPVQQLVVPAADTTPHFAYASCSGFHNFADLQKLEENGGDPWKLWNTLTGAHQQKAFHLLVLGGDQVYADKLWFSQPLSGWRELSRAKQAKTAWSAKFEAYTRAGFLDIYLKNWARPSMAAGLARIPAVMMWDDHDICDGWGSHPDDVQQFNVMQGLFNVAREYFATFQLGQTAATPLPNRIGAGQHFSSLHLLGDVGLLMLDLRSLRTRQQIMFDSAGWAAFFNELDQRWPNAGAGGPRPPRHLLVVSSVPVAYASGPSDLAGVHAWDPITDPQDDMIDQWSDYRHQAERESFIRGLLRFARTRKVRVTIVAGDVHVGALGIIESTRDEDEGSRSRIIVQLISSGIANLPPAGWTLAALRLSVLPTQTLFGDVTGEIVPIRDGLPRLVAARNWLAIRPTESPPNALLAEWNFEDVGVAPSKTITAG